MHEVTYAEAIREAMSEEMRRDSEVFLMGEDVGVYGGAFGVSLGMIQEFGPERIRDTPISEAAIIGAATGAALLGMRPIAEIQFSDFILIGMDQLVNQAAKLRYMFGGRARVPMVVRSPAGSGTGAAAQHSQSLEALYCHVPGLVVVAPSTPMDAKGLLKAAIRNDNPVLFFEQKLLYNTRGSLPEEDFVIPIGRADTKRAGDDLVMITYGRMVQVCVEAAEALAPEGRQAQVLDLRTLRPLDSIAIVEAARRTGRVLVVHEACLTGGLGAEVAAIVADSDAFYYLEAPVRRVAGLDVPIPYCPDLERAAVPTVARVTAAARELLGLQGCSTGG